MKKIILLATVSLLVSLSLFSCLQSSTIVMKDNIPNTDQAGIYITIDSVDTSGKYDKLCASWHNETDNDVTYGLWYIIEYCDDGVWKNITIKDFSVPEIACTLNSKSTSTETYSTAYFNLSKAGTYRLRTEFYIVGDQISTHGITYAEFEVSNDK